MDVEKVRQDFPFFSETARGKPLVYFDSACQSLRPRPVMAAVNEYYTALSACSGRSMHRLAEEVTRRCERTRVLLAEFLHAARKEEIIFTRNTTEGINLVANSLGLQKGEVVCISDKEHNSNLLPWQAQVKKRGIVLKVVPYKSDNTFDLEAFQRMLDKRVRLVSLACTSNLDGVEIPAEQVIHLAHGNGSLVLLDAAQTAPRRRIDVKALDADFIAFSGHKLLGPSGTGVLYGKYHLLEAMEPFLVGGGTVAFSTYDSCSFLPPPEKFEAGLQDYGGLIGLEAALRYLQKIGFAAIQEHELLLNRLISEGIRDVPGIKLIGPLDAAQRGGIVSFYLEGIDCHRVALMLDQMAGIMVRSGQHCVHSWFDSRRIQASVRLSAYFYNTVEEAEIFIASLQKIRKVL